MSHGLCQDVRNGYINQLEVSLGDSIHDINRSKISTFLSSDLFKTLEDSRCQSWTVLTLSLSPSDGVW